MVHLRLLDTVADIARGGERMIMLSGGDDARQALEVHRSSQPREASVDVAQQLLTVIERSVTGSPPQS